MESVLRKEDVPEDNAVVLNGAADVKMGAKIANLHAKTLANLARLTARKIILTRGHGLRQTDLQPHLKQRLLIMLLQIKDS